MKEQFLIFILLGFLFIHNANAIVNMESLHLRSTDSGTSGNFRLNSSGAYGNSEQFRASAAADLFLQHTKSLNYISLNHSYGESFSREDENKSYVHFRYIDDVESRSTWEVFTQAEQNKFSRLNFRGLVGAGVRWRFLTESKTRISVFGAGAYYSQEHLTHSDIENENRKLEITRANFYWVFRMELFENAKLYNTTYYQPALDDFGDYRILEIAGIKISLANNLFFNLFGEGTYDSKPPANVRKTDITYNTGIEYKF